MIGAAHATVIAGRPIWSRPPRPRHDHHHDHHHHDHDPEEGRLMNITNHVPQSATTPTLRDVEPDGARR
jgi:hypothetical protein